MLKLFKLISFLLCIISFFPTYSSSWETINDLKQSISLLQDKQKEIYINNPDLSSIEDIKWFLKFDLTDDQIIEVNKIIWEYNSYKESIKNDENYQGLLMSKKRETYKNITIYVKQDKLDEYLDYIKNNLETVKKDIDIKSEINKKQELLEAKVDAIKEKIKENKDEVENNLIDIINQKIDEKINNLKNNNDFQKLNLNKKKYVIAQIIKKIEFKKESKIKSWNSIKEREIYVYDTLLDKLKELVDELK